MTHRLYRCLHAELFGGADRYFIPFVSPTSEHLFTARELQELSPEQNRGIHAVPQILTKCASDFLWAVQRLADMGYREANLNLGCPSATVTAKGKGAGLLRTPENLERLLDGIFAGTEIAVSVKTRIGFYDTAEYPVLLELLNRYPFREIILHPRTRQEMYTGRAHREVYEAFARACRVPVSYNGDIFTPEDAAAFIGEFPFCPGLMLARGATGNPALFRQIRGGPPASREELRVFHERLYAGCRELYGPFNGMRRTKEVWSHLIALFEDDGRLSKTLRRTRSIPEFESAVASVLNYLPLKGKPGHENDRPD